MKKENNNPVGAIKTEYKGYCFDSRTEARWAVFFDACGVDWEYRSKTFDLRGGERYRPDFLLHGVAGRDGGDLYIEVKGCMDDERAKKVESFIKLGASVAEEGAKFGTAILLVGNIPNGSTADKILENIQKTAYETWECELNYYNFSTIDGDMFAAYPGVNKDGYFELFGDDYSYLCDMDRDATAEAYCKARKFKFGEEAPSKVEIVPNKVEIVPNKKLTLAELPDEIAAHYPELERIKEKFDSQEVWIEALTLGSYNYDAFRKLGGNRITGEKRVDDLMESFDNKDVFNPIKTNEDAEITDGQGRYEARKKMGLPIHFTPRMGEGIEECRAMNQSSTPWNANYWVPSYAADGNENYILFDEVHKETNLAYEIISKLCGRNDGMSYAKKIRKGTFLFTQTDAEKVRYIVRLSLEIKEALTCKKRLNATFCNAVRIMSEFADYNHKRMLTNCRNCRGSYNQMSSSSDQLKEFSRIYNSKGKTKLYFEDYMKNKGRNVRGYENMDRSWADKRKKDVSTLR